MKKILAVCALAALLLLGLVDVALSIYSTALANSPWEQHPSHTIADSRSRAAFMERVTFTPSTVNWNSQRLTVKEAWLEHRTEIVQIYVIVPFVWEHRQYRKADGYNLCFNLAEGWEVLWSDPSPFFVVEGHGRSFAQRGAVVLWEHLDDLEQFPASILMTDNWKFENSKALEMKRGPH